MNLFLLKSSTRTALILLAFALIGTALLAFVFNITRGAIEHNEEQRKLELISQTLPKDMFDNDLINDVVTLAPDKLLGTESPTPAYRAKLKSQPSALVLEAIAPDGYSGKIKLLIAIRNDGEITGVRVISHKETPGLGDYIEIAKSNWIKVFDGKSLDNHKEKDWQVKKDGGKFDYMTGATITPRAMVRATHKALEYYAIHGTQIFAAATKKQEPSHEPN